MAPSKSVTFTSGPADRKCLRTHKWRRIGTAILVILHVGDLGAHLNIAAAQMVGSTLIARMRETTRSVIRIRNMKAPYARNAAVIRTKMQPKGFYGCETAPVNESAMRTFRVEVVNAVTYTTRRRSTDINFAVASNGSDIDPGVEVYVRRVNGFRRALATNTGNKEIIEGILLKLSQKR